MKSLVQVVRGSGSKQAKTELIKVREALCLMHSMILSGEQHSESSRKRLDDALAFTKLSG